MCVLLRMVIFLFMNQAVECSSNLSLLSLLFFFFLIGNNISLKGEGYKKGRRNNRDPETAQEQRLQRPETEQTLKKLAQCRKR